MALAISFDDVAAAAQRLAGVAHRTPVMTSRTADALCGGTLFFKCENLQRMGAFKFRGAYNALAQFTPEQRRAGVIAFSSGNHAQAIALSARLLGMPAAIVMPKDAPQMKIDATRGYGAEVLLYDRYTENREALGAKTRRGARHDADPAVRPPARDGRAGHGGARADRRSRRASTCCSSASAAAASFPAAPRRRSTGCRTCAVIGVEPEAGNDVQQSLARGEIVHIDVPRTIADGAQTQHAGRYTFPVIQALVDEVVTVTDEQLVKAMRFFGERMKIVVEPTGCLGAAAALDNVVDVRGKRVGVILSGGNIDLRRYAELVAPAR